MPAPHSRSADTRSGSRERCCRALSLVAMSSGEPTETISPPISSESTHRAATWKRSEEHTSELQSRPHLVCRLLLEKKKMTDIARKLAMPQANLHRWISIDWLDARQLSTPCGQWTL